MDDNSANATPAPRKPVIVIIGSTGTGKSNLAVSIAKHLESSTSLAATSWADNSDGAITSGAEIVNADAMQLYTGLPIITNKIPVSEQESVPHHLLGGIGLDEETWTVNKFVKEADRAIKEIHGRGKIPIVVGGTGYYVHGLLLNGSALGPRDVAAASMNAVDGAFTSDEHQDRHVSEPSHVPSDDDAGHEHAILAASTEEIYAKLQEVDPGMASKWHPKDRRKIQRSLEIWLKTGQKASDVYALQKASREQRPSIGGATSGVELSLRYNSIILWLDAEDLELKQRLNDRVDAMLQNGLLTETREMSRTAAALADKGKPVDKSKGIWASIGYKELEPWVEAEKLSFIDEPDPKLDELCRKCIEDVKAGTRRYAKRQNRYIRIRLTDALVEAGAKDKLFLLDCSSLSQWRHTVVSPACTLVESFLSGTSLPQPQSLSDLARTIFQRIEDEEPANKTRFARYCQTCNKTLMTEKEWDKHVESRSHKKILDGMRKRARLQAILTSSTDEPPP